MRKFCIHLLAVFAILTVAGCSSGTANIPSIEIDAQHSQVNGAAGPHYTLAAKNAFAIDTSKFSFDEQNGADAGVKVIRVIITKNVTYTMPFNPKKSRYVVKVEHGFTSGQQLIVGIGYLIADKGQARFAPTWSGFVDIK